MEPSGAKATQPAARLPHSRGSASARGPGPRRPPTLHCSLLQAKALRQLQRLHTVPSIGRPQAAEEREPTVAERHFANLTCFQAVGLSQGAPCFMLRAALCRYLPASLAKLAHSASISALTPARPAVKLGAGTANILPQPRNTQPEKLRRLRSSSLQEERVSSKQLAKRAKRLLGAREASCEIIVCQSIFTRPFSRSHAAQCRILSFSAVRPALHELSQSRQTF